jgi:hypothetical protein
MPGTWVQVFVRLQFVKRDKIRDPIAGFDILMNKKYPFSPLSLALPLWLRDCIFYPIPTADSISGKLQCPHNEIGNCPRAVAAHQLFFCNVSLYWRGDNFS